MSGCLGTPEIVVEVLSPGNNAKKLKKKKEIYEEAGVKEYWVVSPQNKWFKVYTLTDGLFVASLFLFFVMGDIIYTSVLEGFTTDITILFQKTDDDNDKNDG